MKQIKELQRLLGKKIMEVELLKEMVGYGREKIDSARALAARGYELTLISRCLNVSRAQLSLHLHRPADWQGQPLPAKSRRLQACSPDSEAHR